MWKAAVPHQKPSDPTISSNNEYLKQSPKKFVESAASSSSSLEENNDDNDSAAMGHPLNRDENAGSKLGVLPLAVIVFYSVSGGPFGVEESVRAAGNFWTLAGFLVMPWVWSVPEALMTAELASTFPEASGGVVWVEKAFGPLAGWMTGYLGWVSGATDNAIYPVLFLDYLLQVVNGDKINPVLRFVLLSTTTTFLAFVNWLGLKVVGNMSIVICIIAMSPFVLLVIFGAPKVHPSRWFAFPSEDLTTIEEAMDDDFSGGLVQNATWGTVLWRPFLNNLYWNLNAFDSAASFAGDALDPARTVPRAMMLSALMVSLCYFLPLLIALGASDAPQHEWVDGYLATAASQIVGKWLGDWTVFAAAISNIALFQAQLSSDAFQLMGMSDRGYLPKILSVRSSHGTPTYAILLGLAVIVFMGVSNLDKLIEMLNFNYSLSVLLEYSAFIALRVRRADIVRPFSVPLGTVGCIVALIPTFVMTVAVLSLATYKTYLFSFAVNSIGLLLYFTSCGRKDTQVSNGQHAVVPQSDDGGESVEVSGMELASLT